MGAKKLKRIISLLSLACSISTVLAQERPRIVSPEVQPDGRVVLRLWAPQASDVQLSGDWMGTLPPVKLAKGGDGVWTVTVGPLAPNIYTYAFLVDGVRASDPSCRCTLAWAGRSASSNFVVSAESPQVWDNQNNPPRGAASREIFLQTAAAHAAFPRVCAARLRAVRISPVSDACPAAGYTGR